MQTLARGAESSAGNDYSTVQSNTYTAPVSEPVDDYSVVINDDDLPF